MTGVPQILNSVVYILCRGILKLFLFPKEGISYSCNQLITSQNVFASHSQIDGAGWQVECGRKQRRLRGEPSIAITGPTDLHNE